QKDIPIVFYGINDPDDFLENLHIAQQADYIFTHSIEMVSEYKEQCVNARSIEVMNYPINPSKNNPIGSRNKTNKKILFAEPWDQKNEQNLNQLFNTVIESNQDLCILNDSSTDKDLSEFPERYHQYILDHSIKSQINKVYKLFDFVISLNHNQTSQSAYSHNINEILASGSAVLTNYQPGVNSVLPHVMLAGYKEETKKTLNSISNK